MKFIYWNIRGIANSPSRLALKKLILSNKPDFVFISEPWMPFENFPFLWLHRLGFKLFSRNNRENLHPNLWCFCLSSYTPSILDTDDQHVSFSIKINNLDFFFAAIYASTSNIRRQYLWQKLNYLQTSNPAPWCFIGDFNTILGAHEHLGSFSPARPPMLDFQNWTDNFDLIHIPTRGAAFTWNNGRIGRRHTKRRLDRSVCNQLLLDSSSSVSCSTLVKTRSDHYPLLLEIKTDEVQFASSFKFLKAWTLHKDCKAFINDAWNENIVGCPMYVLTNKLKALKNKLKIWNKDVFGNIHSYVTEAEQGLQDIQHQIHLNGHNDVLMQDEKNAQLNLDDALKRQEIFWQEKARVNWQANGDRNTKYFHRVTKIKNKTKIISTIRNNDEIISDPHRISEHIVDYYQNLFFSTNSFLQEQLLVEEVIPKMIDDTTNNLLIMSPSELEVKNAVFGLNPDGAPGPDGFGACFYQTYWEIIKKDVLAAVLQFFQSGWLPPNYNSNTLILIPKSSNADSIDQYRPIALANFKFKIITKVLADRLSQILPNLISKEQRGFIRGRNIKDCIALTSEAINVLDTRCFGGNLALKIDVSKAFDTLSWEFLINVLKGFGFHNTFCFWIGSILQSANISVSINGSHEGHFKCNRGVRQGDPLSPLLFCIAEEVLSRGISNLVDEGKVYLIKASRHANIPSHCFYADDLMVFCKGKFSSLQALKDLFTRYANSSGQVINLNKSSIYAGGVSDARMNQMVQLLGFSIGSLPFTYLGAPIFKGKPKKIHFQHIADKVNLKLANWKASLLSIAGRVQLVKSVVQSMLIHTMSIYSWPVSLLRDLERSIKNFIWSRDVSKRKMVTVAWKKICTDYDEGGLGLRSLVTLNSASNLKICWDLMQSNEQWAEVLRSRVIRDSSCIQHHIFSSIWSGAKVEFWNILDNTNWLVGDGQSINCWLDNWCGEILAQSLNINTNQLNNLPRKLSNFIHNRQWKFPNEILSQFPNLETLAAQINIPNQHNRDTLVWKHTTNGVLSLKDAYKFKKGIFTKVPWAKLIWSADIPPSKSLLVWRLMLDKVPTDDILTIRGCHLPSMCSLCSSCAETSIHLFFECTYALNLWRWLASIINYNFNFQNKEEIWNICNNSWNPQCKTVITASIINICNGIWYARNQLRFQNKRIPWKSTLASIASCTALSGNLSKSVAFANVSNFMLLRKFNVKLNPPRAPKVIEVIWQPPLPNWTKCNTNGSTNGNQSSCGGIFRNSKSDFLICFGENTGLGNALHAELSGAMRAIELANTFQWKNLWLEADSELVVKAFKNPYLVPWRLKNRWMNCLQLTLSMNFVITHIYREGNQCADTLASIGFNVAHLTVWNVLPDCVRAEFVKNRLGLPNFRFVPF